MQRSLAASSVECAQLLNGLSSLLQDTHSQACSNLEPAAIEDQYGRFSIWAGNLGAFQRLPATSSLDYRLRESPKLATQIQELLQDLYDVLQNIHSIASGDRPNRQDDTDEEDEDEDEDETVHEDADEDRGPKGEEEHQALNDSDVRHSTPLSEAEELFESVKETIASLFRMSIIIRKASPRDRFVKAQASRQALFDESFDIKHIAQKHPLLDSEGKLWLKERLGKAITQRRQYLRYAREHRNKLSKDVSDLWQPGYKQKQTPAYLTAGAMPVSQGGQTNTTKPTSTLAPTAASTLFFADVQKPEKDSTDNRSQTSYALSLGEKDEDLQLQLPRLVDVAQGSSTFECPLCWTIQNIQSESSWRKHGFSDLRPYLCTFKECDLKLFSERGDWFDHEMQHHRAKWRCHFCEQDDFRSNRKFNEHLRQHDVHVSEDQLSALSEASKRSVENLPASDCPFCNEWELKLRQANPDIAQNEEIVVTPTQFRQHVGSHMQQLALFAIPRGYLENDAEEGSIASAAAASVAKETLLSLGTPIAPLPSASSRRGYVVPSKTASEMLRIDSFDGAEPARILHEAISTSPTAFEKAVVRVFPYLLSEECDILQSYFDIRDLHQLQDSFLRRIAYATLLGQWGSDEYWLEHCQIFGRQWWEVAILMLGRRTNADIHLIFQALPDDPEALPAIITRLEDCCDKTNATQNTKEMLMQLPLQYGMIEPTANKDSYSNSQLAEQHATLVAELENKMRIGDFEFLFRCLLSKSDLYLKRLMEFDPQVLGPEQLFLKVLYLYGPETMKLVKHVIDGTVNAPARDARNLGNVLHVGNRRREFVDEYKLSFLAVHLHWNARHLRRVKREFRSLYGQDIENSIRHCTTGNYSTFLIYLMDVDDDPLSERESMLDEPKEMRFLSGGDDIVAILGQNERTKSHGERNISDSKTAHLETVARHNSIFSHYEFESERKLLLRAVQNCSGSAMLLHDIRLQLIKIQGFLHATSPFSMSGFINTHLVDAQSGRHTLPLLEAAKNSDVKVANLLLSFGADVNAALPNGDTAFKVALRFYDFGFIECLLEHGANDSDIETTLQSQWYEAYKGQFYTITDFVKGWWHLVGDTSTRGGQKGADKIRELLSNHTTPEDMVDLSLPMGWTALRYAAVHGNIENARVLIDYSASLWFQRDRLTIGQESVLEVALIHKRQRFVEFLLERGLGEDYVQENDQKEKIRKLVTFSRIRNVSLRSEGSFGKGVQYTFRKGYTVRMSHTQDKTGAQGNFTICNGRAVAERRDSYEYQLAGDDGKLFDGGTWVPEQVLRHAASTLDQLGNSLQMATLDQTRTELQMATLNHRRSALQIALNETVINGGNSFKAAAGA